MKVNSGQAPSTLIPEYLGSDFDAVLSCADNMTDIKTVSENLNDIEAVVDNMGNVTTILNNINYVKDVANNITDVTTVSHHIDDVGVVANNIVDVNTVASNIDDVGAVATNVEYVKNVAEGIAGLPVKSYAGPTPPTRPVMGSEWYCTTDGRTYIWYVDEDSSQWVESSPQTTNDDLLRDLDTTLDPKYKQIFEALRRSYAGAGYTLVSGSFEKGGTLTSATDVLLHEGTGKGYAWTGAFPKVVAAGTDPASGGFVDRSNEISFYYTGRGRLTISTGAPTGIPLENEEWVMIGNVD